VAVRRNSSEKRGRGAAPAAVRSLQPHQDDAFEHDYLYSCLSVLDSKAQALLSYDGILMAASSITLSLFSRDITTGSVLAFASLAASGLSSALCLSVVWVRWTDTGDLENSDDLFLELLRVRNRRTVHLLVHYPPKVAVSKLVNSLKGVSARRIRQEFTGRINRAIMHGHLWSPSYLSASCGGAPLAIVRQYIEQQKRPL
jgi:hypothetical protein